MTSIVESLASERMKGGRFAAGFLAGAAIGVALAAALVGLLS